MAEQQRSRFDGLTSNGALPGGERGWLMRRIQTAYGITPHVAGNEQERGGRQNKKGQRRGKPLPRTKIISSGVERLLPPSH